MDRITNEHHGNMTECLGSTGLDVRNNGCLPDTKETTSSSTNDRIDATQCTYYGISMGVESSCGGRLGQDDRWNAFSFVIQSGGGPQYRCTVGAVLDGHHGHGISDMVSEEMPNVLIASIQDSIRERIEVGGNARNGCSMGHDHDMDGNTSMADIVDYGIQQGLRACIFELDKKTFDAYARNESITGGTTIVIVILVLEMGMLYTGNVGDCKAVMSVLGRAEGLTECHNPPVASEKMRFENAGVSCFSDHIGGSDINVCRTLGDYDLGPPLKWREKDDEYRYVHGPLSCMPDVTRRKLDDLDEFIVIATDGMWDYYTPESSIITDVRRYLRRFSMGEDSADELFCNGTGRTDFTKACMNCAAWLVDASLSRQRDVLHEGTPGDNVTVMFLQIRVLPKIPRARDSRLNLQSFKASQ